MNKIKYLLGISFLLFIGCFYGMNTKKRSYEGASSTTTAQNEAVSSTEAYFVPKDSTIDKLFSFLDNAQREILIAMYWIIEKSNTDRSIIVDKLIERKMNGKNVQIITDESTFKFMNDRTGVTFINRLLSAGIVPLVYISGPEGEESNLGKMHNKFVVVDGAHVWTGSANFTKTAFNLQSDDYSPNYENVIIIKNNRDIARKYRSAFYDIESNIFNSYIELIADNDSNDLLDWFNHLLPRLSQDDLTRARLSLWDEFDQDGQIRLQRFFGLPVERRFSSLTQAQIDTLRRRGLSVDRIEEIEERASEMSREEIFNLIGEVLRGRYRFSH